MKQEYIYKQIYFILLFLVYRYDIMRIKIEGQEDMIMALRYKVDVIQLLKDSGYSTYAIRKEKLIIENMLQKHVGYHLQADAFSARRYFRIRPRRGRKIKVDKLSITMAILSKKQSRKTGLLF